MPITDTEKLKDYKRRYYQLNKERINKRCQLYYEKNKEKIKTVNHSKYLRYKAERERLDPPYTGPCQECGSNETVIRKSDNAILWFQGQDGIMRCASCHAGNVPKLSGEQHPFYGLKGKLNHNYIDKSNRQCYCCGTSETFVKGDGLASWFLNEMNDGVVLYLCNTCWRNIRYGYKLNSPQPTNGYECYCCGSTKTKFEEERGIYRWWLNYPTQFVLCHYCFRDVKEGRPIRTYICDNCMTDTWQQDGKKQKPNTHCWINDDGTHEELCLSCYASKRGIQRWSNQHLREDHYQDNIADLVAADVPLQSAMEYPK